MIHFDNTFITFLLAFTLFGAQACKKDNSNNGDTENLQDYTPPHVDASSPGILQTSVSALSVKVGATANIIVQLYHSNGSVVVPQPSFLWLSTDPGIATINSGLVSGVTIGSSLIKVTDGVHGFSFVNVTVVADTVQFSNEPAHITFNPPIVMLNENGSSSFSFTAYNSAGEVVSANPTFISEGNITVSGNTISAGSTLGLFYVKAHVNGHEVGTLKALVGSASGSQDTITGVVFKAVPQYMSKPGVVSNPIIAEVTRFTNMLNGYVETFQTSPDKITVDANVLVMNSNGGLQAVNPGRTKMKLSYLNSEVVEYETYVLFDYGGCWSTSVETSNLNITFSSPSFNILYQDREFYDTDPLSQHFVGHFTSDNPNFQSGSSGVAKIRNAINFTSRMGQVPSGDQIGLLELYRANGSAWGAYMKYVNVTTLNTGSPYNATLVKGSCSTPNPDNFISFNGTTYSNVTPSCDFSSQEPEITLEGDNMGYPYLEILGLPTPFQDGVTYNISDYYCEVGACNFVILMDLIDSNNPSLIKGYGFTSGTIVKSGNTVTVNGYAKELNGSGGYLGSAIPVNTKITCL